MFAVWTRWVIILFPFQVLIKWYVTQHANGNSYSVLTCRAGLEDTKESSILLGTETTRPTQTWLNSGREAEEWHDTLPSQHTHLSTQPGGFGKRIRIREGENASKVKEQYNQNALIANTTLKMGTTRYETWKSDKPLSIQDRRTEWGGIKMVWKCLLCHFSLEKRRWTFFSVLENKSEKQKHGKEISILWPKISYRLGHLLFRNAFCKYLFF